MVQKNVVASCPTIDVASLLPIKSTNQEHELIDAESDHKLRAWDWGWTEDNPEPNPSD